MTLCSKSIPGRLDLNSPRQYARSGIVCTIPRREASRSASISEMNQMLMRQTHVLPFVRTTIASSSMLHEGRHMAYDIYRITIKEHLDGDWSDWFDGLSITLVDDGETV